MTKRFFLDQHGCAKNQVDGELLIGILIRMGWSKTVEPETADLIIVNSCGFIEPAKRESIEAVIAARAAYPKARILLAGCLAERYGEIFKTEFEEADAFFGNGDLFMLPDLIERMFPQEPPVKPEPSFKKQRPTPLVGKHYAAFSSGGARPFLKPAQKGVCCGPRPEVLNFPRSAFIKITEGCDNCCSFCAIPLIRGSARSRPIEAIVAEIRDFVRQDYKEFNLIGQDLAVYEASPVLCPELSGLAQLLKAISAIEGRFSVRLLYIHPDHFPLDILPIMTADTRFLPYFDIPFQSGSASVLQAMNRCGSAEVYLRLVENIRTAFREAESPYGEAVIRTTFLTGFPGETQEHFDQTTAFLQEVRSLWAGAFTYSQEEGTKAAGMKRKVPAKIAEQRKRILQELQLGITEKKLAVFCGQKLQVLIEEVIPHAERDNDKQEAADECRIALGRAWFQAPDVDGVIVVNFSDLQKDSEGNPITAGSLVQVRITALRGIDLEADAL